MDKNKREKKAYRSVLDTGRGLTPTYSFNSTKQKFAQNSDDEAGLDAATGKPAVKEPSFFLRAQDAFRESPYLSTALAGVFAFLVLVITFLLMQSNEIGSIQSDIRHISSDVGQLQEKYSDNNGLAKDLEFIKSRLNLIEQRLVFLGVKLSN